MKLNIVQVLLSIAINNDWPLHQLDIKNAFLNGDLNEEVYMDIPPGFKDAEKIIKCAGQRNLYMA